MKMRNLLANASVCALIAGLASPALAQSAGGAPGQVEEVIVTGIRGSITNAMQVKRLSDTVSDVISAQDIGKLPDQNVAETLSRIPGIQITRVEGEGAKINVRGIGLNKQLLNGRSFVGAAANGDPNLSDFPSSILASVEVIKSPSADLPEGWLGAIVNMKTIRPLDLRKPLVSATLQGTIGDMSEELGYKGSIALGGKFLDGRIGAVVNLTASEVSGRSDSFWTRGWVRITGAEATALKATGPGAGLTTFYRPSRFEPSFETYDVKRQAYFGSLQFRVVEGLTATLDVMGSKSDTVRPHPASQVLLSNQLTNVVALADGTIVSATNSGPGVIKRPILTQSPSGKDTSGQAFSVDYKRDRWVAQLNVSRSKGTFEGGDGTEGTNVSQSGDSYIVVPRQAAGNTNVVTWDFSGAKVSPNWSLATNYNTADFSQFESFTYVDIARIGKNEGDDVDFSVEYDIGSGFFRSVKVGARKENLSVLARSDNITAPAAFFTGVDRTPTNSLRVTETPGLAYTGYLSDFMPGRSGQFPRQIEVGTFDYVAFRQALEPFRTAASRLSDRIVSLQSENVVDQSTVAAFLRVDFGGDIGDWSYSGNAGVRRVESERTSSGYVTNGVDTAVPVSVGAKFKNTLPAFNLKLSKGADLQFRLAAAKVVARPELSRTGSGLTLAQSTNTGSRGNPLLAPYEATQYDATAEWYFAPASMVSVALFRKDISAFTRNRVVLESHPEVLTVGTDPIFRVTIPENGESGSVQGVELNYFHALTFLPEPFDGLGYNLSYTYADSKTPGIDELSGRTLPLPLSSKHSYNIVGYYEKDRISARLAYNYRSSFLDTAQPAVLGGSFYADGRGQLDGQISYKLNERFRLTLDAINIGRPIRSYYTGTKNRLTVTWQDDQRLYLGVTGTF